jgi:hypothetical protein
MYPVPGSRFFAVSGSIPCTHCFIRILNFSTFSLTSGIHMASMLFAHRIDSAEQAAGGNAEVAPSVPLAARE